MPIPPPLLIGVRRDYTLEAILQEHFTAESAERRVLGRPLPPWQRPEVWSESKKRAFVEGIYLGFGTGYYVVNGCDYATSSGEPLPMSGWLIDGQQRFCALRDYFDGSLVIFGDVSFPTLPLGDRRRFLHQSFPCFELEYLSDEDLLRGLYDRLNFGGVAHTSDQRALPNG